MVGMMPHLLKKKIDDTNTFSPERAIEIRNESFRRLRELLAQAGALGSDIESLDAALQVFAVNRGIDQMQAVITAARNLADRLSANFSDSVILHAPDEQAADNVDFCAEARIARGMLTAPELPSLAVLMGDAA